MALTDYTPTTDFSAEEAGGISGRSTVRTASLDTELANISTGINRANDAIDEVRRSDGRLQDEIVELHTLHPTVLAALVAAVSPRGAWVTTTVYAVRDVVERNGAGYLCVTAHTSGTFATDQGVGYWLKLWDETFECLNAVPADADVLTNRGITYLDEAANKLWFKVRYSNGTTIKTGMVALS